MASPDISKNLKDTLSVEGVENIREAMLATGVELIRREKDLCVYSTGLSISLLQDFGIGASFFLDPCGDHLMRSVRAMYPTDKELAKFPANVEIVRTGHKEVRSVAHWGVYGLDIPHPTDGVSSIRYSAAIAPSPQAEELGISSFSIERGVRGEMEVSIEFSDGQIVERTLSGQEFSAILSPHSNAFSLLSIQSLVSDMAPEPKISESPAP
ncbi:hypothetical protein AA14337_2915 [Acetobacter malorum DSM 14337]|uniref:Uncharacterized protein n=1 Tax=Acetobacter malorum DSM 14337 TaxID=1307910 RepID=A0ABQ0PYI7_9PROT|nr:hypothetical protein AD930_06690 [Acetobacter malorum]GBQ84795.1 hypothetical protein AA14337_2915 [Acetobacter malorum DSM 14337]